MRDLTSRLREIVRQDASRRAAPPGRDLTYVPDGDALSGFDAGRAARVLGGVVVDDAGSCIAIDRQWRAHDWHGRRQVSAYGEQFRDDAPLALFDRRQSPVPGWADRVVFFDIETTGLSGGAGTLAFLVGCAWFDDGDLHVRQYFLSGPAGERTLLAELGRVFDEASLLVTYNGRTFDVPLMETRWAFHRRTTPTDDLPHFDMLPPARRLWGRVDGRDDVLDARSCALSSLERSVLGFHRVGDVPGFEIPTRYFHFLRSSELVAIQGVLDHNRHDLVSLAALTGHALWLAREGPLACREPAEQLGLAGLYERAGEHERAVDAYDLAARTGDRHVRRHALARLAVLMRRGDRFAEAAMAWEGVVALGGDGAVLSPLDRRALEALAIHHEHRVRDLDSATRYAEVLHADASGRQAAEAAHRLGRLRRKIQAARASAAAAAPRLDF
jgi:uncharacterized protein YprB with RNaseH-like and TPR domain